uniref:Nuclear casein kinase and cyclin dependent kinase substrate 1 n=1 Tax=Microcebus murinus TaxID=30608 RepID=A0A8C5XVI9_MICMU
MILIRVSSFYRNRKVVDYSQFQESDDADEDYGRDSGPPAKKIRSSPREAKNKRRSGKNSQEDSEDSEEKDVKTKKDDSHSAEDSEDEKEDHKNVRQQRQAASKAASKQREMLMEDVGSEEEQEEEDEAPFQEKDRILYIFCIPVKYQANPKANKEFCRKVLVLKIFKQYL